ASGDAPSALRFFQESLALSQITNLRSQELDNHFGIGVVYASLGERVRASESLERALLLSRELSNKRIEANTLYQLAILSSQRGNYIDALNQIKSAIDIIERLRTKFVLQDMRAAYLGTVQNFYELYIDTLMQMSRSSSDDYAAQALKVNEMARARSLLD